MSTISDSCIESCSYAINKETDCFRTWYYIQNTKSEFECVVDFFQMKDPEEYEHAQTIYRQIQEGIVIGVQIRGYAAFVCPSRRAKRSGKYVINKECLPEIERMAEYFLEKVIYPDSYLFYDYIANEDSFITGGSTYLYVPIPEKKYIGGVTYKFELSPGYHTACFYSGIRAYNEQGDVLIAEIKMFGRDSISERKRCKKLINKAAAGKILIAKVEGYQIVFIAKKWEKRVLHNSETVRVLLSQMTRFFQKEEIQGLKANEFRKFKDISDEELQRKIKNGTIKDDTIDPKTFVGIGITIVAVSILSVLIASLAMHIFLYVIIGIAFIGALFGKR